MLVTHPYNDYSNFDLNWQPEWHQMKYRHVWASQHQAHGGTEWVPALPAEGTVYHDEVIPRVKSAPIYWINLTEQPTPPEYLFGSFRTTLNVRTMTFEDFPTSDRESWKANPKLLRELAGSFKDAWLLPSTNDYSNFDFTWHPDEFQQDQIHIFPSQHQEVSGMFYIPHSIFIADSPQE